LSGTKITGVELVLISNAFVLFDGSISFDRLCVATPFPTPILNPIHIGRLRYQPPLTSFSPEDPLLSSTSVTIDLVLVSPTFSLNRFIVVPGAGGRVGVKTLRPLWDNVLAARIPSLFSSNATVSELAWFVPSGTTLHIRGSGSIHLVLSGPLTIDFGLDPSAASANVYYWRSVKDRVSVSVPYIWPNCGVIEVDADPLNGDFAVGPTAPADAAAVDEPDNTTRDLSISILVLMVVLTIVVVVFIVLCSKRGGGDAEA
jgi:hypothetical protein